MTVRTQGRHGERLRCFALEAQRAQETALERFNAVIVGIPYAGEEKRELLPFDEALQMLHQDRFAGVYIKLVSA